MKKTVILCVCVKCECAVWRKRFELIRNTNEICCRNGDKIQGDEPKSRHFFPVNNRFEVSMWSKYKLDNLYEWNIVEDVLPCLRDRMKKKLDYNDVPVSHTLRIKCSANGHTRIVLFSNNEGFTTNMTLECH
jgi:hypothetical protein